MLALRGSTCPADDGGAQRPRDALGRWDALQGRRLGRLRRRQPPRGGLQIPFCDFGAVTDPPDADVTAHVVEVLAAAGGSPPTARSPRRGWLLRHQETDGSWFGRWGVNYVYGTGAAIPGLLASGERRPSCGPQGVAWLISARATTAASARNPLLPRPALRGRATPPRPRPPGRLALLRR